MFPKTTACCAVVLLTFVAIAAGAQDLPAWEGGVGAAAETPVAPPPSAAEVAGEPAPVGCVPSCRRGYLCVSGQCVSACNPACGADEICSADGECLSRQPAAAPASQAAPAAAPASVTNVIVAPGSGPMLPSRHVAATEQPGVPLRAVDAPLTLPSGMASWSTALQYYYADYGGDDPLQALIFSNSAHVGLSDDVMLTFAPLGVQLAPEVEDVGNIDTQLAVRFLSATAAQGAFSLGASIPIDGSYVALGVPLLFRFHGGAVSLDVGVNTTFVLSERTPDCSGGDTGGGEVEGEGGGGGSSGGCSAMSDTEINVSSPFRFTVQLSNAVALRWSTSVSWDALADQSPISMPLATSLIVGFGRPTDSRGELQLALVLPGFFGTDRDAAVEVNAFSTAISTAVYFDL